MSQLPAEPLKPSTRRITPPGVEVEELGQSADCRFSEGRDPSFSKPFPPDLSNRLSARHAPSGCPIRAPERMERVVPLVVKLGMGDEQGFMSACGTARPVGYVRRSSLAVTVSPAVVRTLPINWTTVSWSSSGRPRQFSVM